jgi:FPC/CPF motif-containing protein YcgG
LDSQQINPLEKFVSQYFFGFLMNHVCIGAKQLTAYNASNEPPTKDFFVSIYPDMSTVETGLQVISDLEEYYRISDELDPVVKTLALIFAIPISSQEEFASKYWSFAQILHDIDSLSNDYDESVNKDLDSPDFELSLAGRAVFTTTLNPHSPRMARQFNYPTLVMNQIRQFDALRATPSGKTNSFEAWQRGIRNQDAQLDPSGVPNPVLADHGSISAVEQLAGSVPEDFKFVLRKGADYRSDAFASLMEAAASEAASEAAIAELEARYSSRE